MKLKFLLLTVLFVLFGTTVYAASSDSISVNIVPLNPAPYENTSIALSSYSYNLDSVLIAWSVAGKKCLIWNWKKVILYNSARGRRRNKCNSHNISARWPNRNKNCNKTLSVMVLLWQANDSYVPPFYKGRPCRCPTAK